MSKWLMSKRLLLLCGGLGLTLASGLCPAQQDSAAAKTGTDQQPKPTLAQRTDGAELPPELRITPDSDPMPSLEVVTARKTEAKPQPGLMVTTMKNYLTMGYRVPPNRIFGTPSWMETEYWVINGKPSDELRAAMDKMSPQDRQVTSQMEFRSTLRDLFKMKAHIEARQMPYWEVVPAKGGVKIKEVPAAVPLAPGAPRPAFTPGGPPPPGMLMMMRKDDKVVANGRAVTMRALIGIISGMPEIDRRPIVDKTGFTGSFDIVDLPMGSPNPADGEATSVSTILADYGLKLVSTKGPVEVIVVDSIEEAEN